MGLLDDKVALITGAASGIGRASAQTFAREGAAVVCADVDDAGGTDTATMIEKAGGRAIFVHCDVSLAPEVEATVRAAVNAFGGLDCAHNNAGIEGPAFTPMAMCSEEDFDRTIAVNLKGTFLCMKYEILEMLARGGGAIVNTASVAGLIGYPTLSSYTASKHGVVGLTRVAALEYATSGVRVNALCPGGVVTPMLSRAAGGVDVESPLVLSQLAASTPMQRIAQPEEIAELAVWLCSDRASYLTGVPIPVDGGIVAQ